MKLFFYLTIFLTISFALVDAYPTASADVNTCLKTNTQFVDLVGYDGQRYHQFGTLAVSFVAASGNRGPFLRVDTVDLTTVLLNPDFMCANFGYVADGGWGALNSNFGLTELYIAAGYAWDANGVNGANDFGSPYVANSKWLSLPVNLGSFGFGDCAFDFCDRVNKEILVPLPSDLSDQCNIIGIVVQGIGHTCADGSEINVWGGAYTTSPDAIYPIRNAIGNGYAKDLGATVFSVNGQFSTNINVADCISCGGVSPVNGAIFTSEPTGTVVNENHYARKLDVWLNGGPSVANNKNNCPSNGKRASAGLSPAGNYYFQVTDPPGKVLLSNDWDVFSGLVKPSSSNMNVYNPPYNYANIAADLKAAMDAHRTVTVSEEGIFTAYPGGHWSSLWEQCDGHGSYKDFQAANIQGFLNEDFTWPFFADCNWQQDIAANYPDQHPLNDDEMTRSYLCPGRVGVSLWPFLDTPNNGGVYKAWATPSNYWSASSGTITGFSTHGFIHAFSKTDNFKVDQQRATTRPPPTTSTSTTTTTTTCPTTTSTTTESTTTTTCPTTTSTTSKPTTTTTTTCPTTTTTTTKPTTTTTTTCPTTTSTTTESTTTTTCPTTTSTTSKPTTTTTTTCPTTTTTTTKPTTTTTTTCPTTTTTTTKPTTTTTTTCPTTTTTKATTTTCPTTTTTKATTTTCPTTTTTKSTTTTCPTTTTTPCPTTTTTTCPTTTTADCPPTPDPTDLPPCGCESVSCHTCYGLSCFTGLVDVAVDVAVDVINRFDAEISFKVIPSGNRYVGQLIVFPSRNPLGPAGYYGFRRVQFYAGVSVPTADAYVTIHDGPFRTSVTTILFDFPDFFPTPCSDYIFSVRLEVAVDPHRPCSDSLDFEWDWAYTLGRRTVGDIVDALAYDVFCPSHDEAPACTINSYDGPGGVDIYIYAEALNLDQRQITVSIPGADLVSVSGISNLIGFRSLNDRSVQSLGSLVNFITSVPCLGKLDFSVSYRIAGCSYTKLISGYAVCCVSKLLSCASCSCPSPLLSLKDASGITVGSAKLFLTHGATNEWDIALAIYPINILGLWGSTSAWIVPKDSDETPCLAGVTDQKTGLFSLLRATTTLLSGTIIRIGSLIGPEGFGSSGFCQSMKMALSIQYRSSLLSRARPVYLNFAVQSVFNGIPYGVYCDSNTRSLPQLFASGVDVVRVSGQSCDTTITGIRDRIADLLNIPESHITQLSATVQASDPSDTFGVTYYLDKMAAVDAVDVLKLAQDECLTDLDAEVATVSQSYLADAQSSSGILSISFISFVAVIILSLL